MSLVLGIDTGGTFTDCALVDTETRQVLRKAKAPTTREDLAIGITRSIEHLGNSGLDDITFVALSTTLATNAVVEGRRARTGLILIGKQLDRPLPADVIVTVDGRVTIKGQAVTRLDHEGLDRAVERMSGCIDALAISGVASVRNPILEIEAKDYLKDRLSVPIVCAHEMSSTLGFYERTVTCALNAGLIPVIGELITAVGKALVEHGIDAPIMVVKGDGALMHQDMAVDRPVETVLSGPAASIAGAQFLSGARDAVVLDMGGTTTDVALLSDGRVRLREDGARVGTWRTRIKTADVRTYGLGGDSRIFLNAAGGVRIGPRRVIPLCVATRDHPELAAELQAVTLGTERTLVTASETDCFRFVKRQPTRQYTAREEQVLALLQDAPHSLLWLAGQLGSEPEGLPVAGLVEDGTVAQISLTPTDLQCIDGRIPQFRPDISMRALQSLAERAHMSADELRSHLDRMIKVELATCCVQSACDTEEPDLDVRADLGAQFFLGSALSPSAGSWLRTTIGLTAPVVAIGAPAAAWMPPVASLINTAVEVPEHAEVANAVGAAVASISEMVEVLVRPEGKTGRFVVFTPTERLVTASLDEALTVARDRAAAHATARSRRAGAEQIEVVTNEQTEYATKVRTGRKKFIEARLQALAVGQPVGVDTKCNSPFFEGESR
jgi:N-methylhydantoinase A/oxoprolinase/acetone carboxylase beta subunit